MPRSATIPPCSSSWPPRRPQAPRLPLPWRLRPGRTTRGPGQETVIRRGANRSTRSASSVSAASKLRGSPARAGRRGRRGRFFLLARITARVMTDAATAEGPSQNATADSRSHSGSSGSRPPPPAPQHCDTSCSRRQRPSSPGLLASTIKPPAGSRSTLARPGTSMPAETTHSHRERLAAQEYALFRYAAVPVRWACTRPLRNSISSICRDDPGDMRLAARGWCLGSGRVSAVLAWRPENAAASSAAGIQDAA